jgi:two-component system LytT family response regulator
MQREITAIIVDDISGNIENINEKLYKYCPHIKVVATAKNGKEALMAIRQHDPEIVFLDIEMPDMTGFEVLEILGLPPKQSIIFCTAHDSYAMAAFRYSAIDFLIKPLEPKLLQEAIRRAEQSLKQRDEKSQLEQYRIMFDVLQQDKQAQKQLPKRIAVNTHSEMILIEPTDVVYFEADGSYTNIFLENVKNPVISSKPLKHYRDLVYKGSIFFDSHRSFIVNIEYIKRINRQDRLAIMSNDKKILIAEAKLKELSQQLNVMF